MGKKKRGFEWVRDDVEDEAIEVVERRNRSSEKRRLKELEALARALAELSPGNRRRLPVDDDIIAALDDLAATRPTPDRRRKLLRVKLMLAEVDEPVLEQLRAAIS